MDKYFSDKYFTIILFMQQSFYEHIMLHCVAHLLGSLVNELDI